MYFLSFSFLWENKYKSDAAYFSWKEMLISIQRLLTVFFLFLPVHRDEEKGMREGREPSEEFFFSYRNGFLYLQLPHGRQWLFWALLRTKVAICAYKYVTVSLKMRPCWKFALRCLKNTGFWLKFTYKSMANDKFQASWVQALIRELELQSHKTGIRNSQQKLYKNASMQSGHLQQKSARHSSGEF